MLTSAVVAAAIVTAVVLVAGALSGRGPTLAVPAQAAVLRGALHALDAAPGTIVDESYDTFWPAMGRDTRSSNIRKRSTRRPPAAERRTSSISYGPGTTETVTMNGETEDYDPSNDTIYTAVDINTCNCDLTPGSAPGTSIVSLRRTPGARRNSAAWEMNEHPPGPLTITNAQARALRDGADSLSIEPRAGTSGQGRWRMTIVASWRVPSETGWIQAQLPPTGSG